MAERLEFTTPVGRLVAGDLWTPRTTDQQGNPLEIKTGPNKGQPTQKYFIGLAIPKTDAGFNDLWAVMNQVAKQGFPNLFDAQGNCLRPDFAWKFTDGDSQIPNRNNVRPCDKEGYPGHWVINMETSIAPKVLDRDIKPIPPESKAIKRGDYIRVHISLAANGQTSNPGLYLNPSMVQFSHAGDEIFSGPDANAVFGAAPLAAAPAGASTIPAPSLSGLPTGTIPAPALAPQVPPANTSAPAVPGMPQGGTVAAPGVVPGMSNGATPAVTAHVTPAHDFLNPQTAPAPAPVVENFVVNGQVYSRDQLRAAGWTDAQIDTQVRA